MTFNWKKTLIVALNIAMTVYLVLAITAFNKPDESNMICTQVEIKISDGIVDGFLNTDEIKKILQRNNIYPLTKPLNGINVRQIEETLQKSPFVDKAECYKTINGHVCIELTQRMPVIRVKADNGDDYYIDNHGGLMPNTKYTTNLTIATGAVNKWYARHILTKVGNHIIANKFWRNQIVQINVLNDGTMEMVPRVGDNIIYIGKPQHIDKKLRRLEKFYRYGLSHAGWNKYSDISLEFDNQIICKKKQNNI